MQTLPPSGPSSRHYHQYHLAALIAMASNHFARSLRAALNAPVSQTAVASSSRTIATSASLHAQSKSQQAQKTKRKTTLKKNTPSGPRSTGVKRKGTSSVEASSSSGLSTPFYRPAPDLSGQWTTLTPDSAKEGKVDEPMAFSKSDLEAFEQCGVEPKIKKSVSLRRVREQCINSRHHADRPPSFAQLASYIQPVSVVRSSTLDLYTRMNQAASSSSSSHVALSSPLSTGKSYLLLQAVSYALASQWCVVYLPRLINWVNSTSTFVYSAEEQAYLQPQVVQQALAAVGSVNGKSGVLKKIKLVKDVEGTNLKAGEATMQDLLKAASASSTSPLVLQRIFDSFLSSLSSQSEVPVLLAMDDAQALYSTTRYRDPDYKLVQAYELAPVRSLLNLLMGDEKKSLKKGMVLAALSRSHTEWLPGNEIEAVLSSTTTSTATSALNPSSLHAYATMEPLHLEHAKRSRWENFQLPEQWSTSELKALFDVRRYEGRGWNAPAAMAPAALAAAKRAPLPAAAKGAAAAGSSASAYDPMRLGVGAGAAQPAGRRGATVGAGAATEDELFLMRVVDSARNPYRFDQALKGGSIL